MFHKNADMIKLWQFIQNAHGITCTARRLFSSRPLTNGRLEAFLRRGMERGDLRRDLAILPTIFTFWGALSGLILLADQKEAYLRQAAEAVLEKSLQQQRIDVDTVSGAANSSKVLKKAVEDALKSGLLSPAGA